MPFAEYDTHTHLHCKPSMKEKELKILDIDPLKVIAQLEALGAEKAFAGVIADQYYDFPGRELKEKGYSIRIRTIDGKSYQLCFKEKVKHKTLKVRKEYEIDLVNYKHGEYFITGYGLFPTFYKEKMRISYHLDGIKFDMDRYPGLKPMLEIEAPKKKQIMKWIAKLGLENHETSKNGARKLLTAVSA